MASQLVTDDRKTVADQAIDLLQKALNAFKENASVARSEAGGLMFFPSGIELIAVKLEVLEVADVTLVFAGKDAPAVQIPTVVETDSELTERQRNSPDQGAAVRDSA